jgi:uncharacterized membrane protein YhiD involved in acid resistance
VRILVTIVGLAVLVWFAGELSLAVGPTIGVGFATVGLVAIVLVAILLFTRWRSLGRRMKPEPGLERQSGVMVPRSSLAANEREAIERIRNHTATEDDYRLFSGRFKNDKSRLSLGPVFRNDA